MDEWSIHCVYDEHHAIGPNRSTRTVKGQWYAMPHRPIPDEAGGYMPLYEEAVGPFNTKAEAQAAADRGQALTDQLPA